MVKYVTQVFQMPSDQDQRTRFTNGVNALMKECGVELVAGSSANEIDKVEAMAKALPFYVAEEIEQRFDKQSRGV
ncbi:hypothetical protein [Pseudomonas syringae]|uniref:hypothetical protein n=1 Tax=Pseudomonas syringae TaxID=317 RepID=UPI001F47C8F9|nr:hypothetical protein [Pseudomonas syringae]MCF5371255.1 hypothetical protein [Pseudomonas syringae]MCF5382150.1 hypothetical protein [Pseudomonas syringae]MCF5423517.1 hypothetical protein [Pseudomonas syringae]MCF5455342.1 hypothetical protein [Pseudomonas syringae]MCF5460681.1 hypothetical protein [Pseudomonas syringae]